MFTGSPETQSEFDVVGLERTAKLAKAADGLTPEQLHQAEFDAWSTGELIAVKTG